MKYFALACFLLFLTLSSGSLLAQDAKEQKQSKIENTTPNAYNIRITDIYVDEDQEKLKIRLNGLDPHNEPFLKLDKRQYVIEEIRNDKSGTVDIVTVEPPQGRVENGQKVVSDGRGSSAYFLLDISGSMKNVYDEKIRKAKNAIVQMLGKYNFDRTYLRVFNGEVMPTQPISAATSREILNRYSPIGGTAIYEAIIKTVKDVQATPGRKYIFVLTDGADDRNQFTQNDVFDVLRSLDQNILVYTLGVHFPGAYQYANPRLYEVDDEFLSAVAAATPNPNDNYKPVASADDISLALDAIVGETQDHIELNCTTPFPLYSGIERTIRISYKEGDQEIASAERGYLYGSPTSKIDISPNTYTNPWNVFGLGVLIVVVMLIAFAIGLPIIYRQQFRRKYVKPYHTIETGRRRPLNPTTDEPFDEYDQVVTKCSHLMTYDDWKAYGNKCLYYPRQCSEGVDNLSNSRFFNQQGLNRLLNWLWFGTWGALLAWGLSRVLQVELTDLKAWLSGFSFIYDKDEELNLADPVFRTMMTGIGIGGMLSFALSWVEELGQGSKVSWGRILLRTGIGLLACTAIYMISILLFVKMLNVEYFGELILWVLSGTVLGAILSISSSIELKTGAIGGLIASVIGFHVNYLVAKIIFSTNPEYGDMLGFMCYGGILGATIFRVVSQLENFNLEYLSPAAFRGRVTPISKWLKTGLKIYIGTDDGCHVFVKWEDPAVEPRHAQLSYNSGDGEVLLTPIGETLINGRVVKKEVKLSDGDEIKLGHASKSIMRYREKRSESTDSTPSQPKGKEGTSNVIQIRAIRRKSTNANP